MSIERIAFAGLPNCLKLSNGVVDLIATTDVGPRILHYGLRAAPNVLALHLESSVSTDLGTWKPYGGHRLWVWPELFPATYAPDNTAIEHIIHDELSLTLRQALDAAGIIKEIRVTMSSTGSTVKLEQSITSMNLWPVEIAPWAISVVECGTAILPRVPFQSHDDCVAAAQPLTLNSFTDLQDPRFTLHQRYLLLQADPTRLNSQKIGLRNKEGWCAHLVEDTLFVKRFEHCEHAEYPDYGVNNEVYIAGAFMEVELLGPKQVVIPGSSIVFKEEWSLFAKVRASGKSIDTLGKVITPLIDSLF